MSKNEHINPQDVWFTIPSMSAALPETSKAPVFDSEGEDLHEDEWRQLEFLPKDALPKIEADMKGIRNVLEHHAKRTQEGFGIFRECYIREYIGEPELQLPFDECMTLLNAGEPQNIRIVGQYVKGGFYVETAHSAYYGIVENEMITTLCLDTFSEQTAGEVRELTSRFGLVFVDWCACKIVTPDA